jgi:NAD(P)-dependent dehydrogenase (short-subunit alcohol dehydrogenase family)
MNYLDKLFSLKGKIALVTGACGGIGGALADALLKAKATVILVDKNQQFLIDQKNSLKRTGLNAYEKCCDITDLKQLDELVRYVKSVHQRIDILVNCAGISFQSDGLEYPDEMWHQTMKVNLEAPFQLSKHMGKLMKKQGNGSIINITSINAELGFTDNPAYIASKGGLKQLTKSLAMDLGKFGVRANAIGPGYFRTQISEKSWNDLEKRKERAETTLLNRWGQLDDLYGLVIFLASDASSYITGQDIYIDGGFLMKGI